MAFETTHLLSYLVTDGVAVLTHSAHEIADFSYGSVQLAGTFTGVSVQLQISNDNENWINFGAALTTAGMTTLALYAGYIRVNVTAWVSGSFNVILIGKRNGA